MVGEQAGQTDVTREHFTLLSSDLCQCTRLNEWVDPELVREINHHIKESADVILREHTGLLNQDYGDGVMAIFGGGGSM